MYGKAAYRWVALQHSSARQKMFHWGNKSLTLWPSPIHLTPSVWACARDISDRMNATANSVTGEKLIRNNKKNEIQMQPTDLQYVSVWFNNVQNRPLLTTDDLWRNCNRDKAAGYDRKIQIDVKPVLPRSEWLDKFHCTYGTLRLHRTRAAAEASYDRTRSSAL